jgi:hypothetical protein
METRTCPAADPCPPSRCARFESDDPRPSSQGWDRADFHCGRCGEHITATTEDDYVVRVTAHQTAHDLLDASTPELRARLVDLALAEVETALTT